MIRSLNPERERERERELMDKMASQAQLRLLKTSKMKSFSTMFRD